MSKETNPPTWKRIAGSALYASFLGVVLLVSTAAGWIRTSPLFLELVKGQIGITPKDPKEVFHDDSLTLLILGCDQDLGATYSEDYRKELARKFYETGERPHISKKLGRGKARTDMILVAKLDFAKHTITGVSVPRDVQCHLPGYRPMKINAYYSVAANGQEKELAKTAIEYLLPGVHIDRVVTLDYDAFQKVVDLVGGVPVDVLKDMQYVDAGADLFINLKKGHQLLNGYDAMGFVRFRHNDSDFERQKRQKELIASLKQQILSAKNLTSLPAILEQSKQVLGSALSDNEIAGLAGFAQKVPQQNIKLGMIPVIEKRHSTFLLVDEEKLPGVLADSGLIPTPASQARTQN